ncbi:MAG: 2-hydroxyacyl-CoA dehydratase [Clostridia bacterium]|nr:2-hydroxyacyl-CoA dehydratase [Clostridia bacterium]
MTEKNYVPFTKEMISEYTILAPNMLPIHFNIVLQFMRDRGYTVDLLTEDGPEVAETGLKYVHNDTCYPAILVIGQFMRAIESGKYDPHKVALVYFQTGGGCRASNYIFLLRKALKKAGYDYVPVISISFDGLEKHPGFKIDIPTWYKLLYGIMYADLIMALSEQVKPYEKRKGEAAELADKLSLEVAAHMKGGVGGKRAEKMMRDIVKRFAAIEQDRSVKKPRVGIVGEIYVKFSPLGNNNLGGFLVENGAEVVLPGLMNFMLYCVYNKVEDYELYHRGNWFFYQAVKIAYKVLLSKQKSIAALIEESGIFRAAEPFDEVVDIAEKCIGRGCKMGEGWLLPAEMLSLAEHGTPNIVCTQPFGCLPNHICGKGMMKPIKEHYPNANIIAVDYDASASRVNQENRIKLMLANAKVEEVR